MEVFNAEAPSMIKTFRKICPYSGGNIIQN